jgi:hypothetical protein
VFSSCDRCDEKRENILLSEDNDVNKNDNSNGDRKTLCRGRRESASLKRDSGLLLKYNNISRNQLD